MNKQKFHDAVIEIGIHQKKTERQAPETENFTNLYVSGLELQTTQKQFSELFSKYGEILSIQLKVNKDGSKTGIGYVNFAKTEDAQKAMAELNKFETSPGNCILVAPFVSRKENEL